MISLQDLDPLYIPLDKRPEHVIYGWVRYEPTHEFSLKKLEEAIERGWEPVPLARHPNYVEQQESAPVRLKGFVYYQGLVLCEKLKERYDFDKGQDQNEVAKAHISNLYNLNEMAQQLGFPLIICDEKTLKRSQDIEDETGGEASKWVDYSTYLTLGD